MPTRLFIGNLNFDTIEADIRTELERFGKVEELKLMLDRETGRSRGFAFATMATPEAGDAAIEGLHESDLDGRQIKVNEAKPKPEYSGPRGGGGGGHRSGGGRQYRDDR